MNKQGLWFLTLFSLVLVLGVYYVTMPNDAFNKKKSLKNTVKKVSLEKENLDVIESYKEAALVERETEKKKLEKTLTNKDSDTNAKKEAYEKIKSITDISSKEEEIEKDLKKNLKLNCFIKISDNTNMKVFCTSKNPSKDLAVDVMHDAQNLMSSRYNISVKFSK